MKNRILIAAGLAVASSLFLAGCNPAVPDGSPADTGTTDGSPVNVSIATQPWIGYGPWQIAVEKGFDTDHGVKLDLITFNTDSDMISAFGSGRVPLADAALNTSAVYSTAGQDVSNVLIQAVTTTADAVMAGPGLDTAESLRGKRVAFEEGATSDILIRDYLATAGMTLDDITVVGTPASSAGAALLSGGVDAAVTYEPYLSATLGEGSDLQVVHTAAETFGLITDALLVNPDWAKENSETLENVLLAWNDAVEFFEQNPTEGQTIITTAIGADPAEFAETFKGIQLMTLTASNEFFADDYGPVADVLKNLWQTSGDAALAEVDLAGIADPSFGEAALARR
ncbi:ABC transporter substrate-binding protein [Homoserinimonas sp. OAct 916]|uniref:ABC transporter substrate-binding protein n=1 Tax=Homoserinimonas sp. OAct 916 TaxID=2211450 RepID=UPI0013006809|nr:ABC transporter substrate-binding protein [Homoserinimonas sp. OAct 916]